MGMGTPMIVSLGLYRRGLRRREPPHIYGFDVVLTTANPVVFDVVSNAANPMAVQIDVVPITAKSRAPRPQQNRRGFPETKSIFQWFPV